MAREPIVRIIPPVSEPIGNVIGDKVYLSDMWRKYLEGVELQMGGEGVDGIAASELTNETTAQILGIALIATRTLAQKGVDDAAAAKTIADQAVTDAAAADTKANDALNGLSALQDRVTTIETNLTTLTNRVDDYNGTGPIT